MYATVDPTTGAVVKEFPTLTDAEVAIALDSAAASYRSWSRTALAERAAILRRMAGLYRDKVEEFAALTTLEMGKPISQARAEVELAASIYDYYATSGPDLLKDEELDIAGTGRALVRTASIGPLLGIMPWNFPLYQVTRFVAPNLLLGNTILLKHAPNCPKLSLEIEETAFEAGVPEGVYRSVFTTHEQVATMIASPLLQGVSLTGSERAGRTIGALAGQHLKKCVLELGGSDPLIVLPQADIDQAVSAAANGRFWNGGQVCTSMKRAIVTEEIWDEFVPRFLVEAATWSTGDPTSDDTRLGPLSSVTARDEVAAQVADAVAKGATLHLGGEVPQGPGAYYPATVLSGVTPDMRAYREEIFGPVAVLYCVKNTDAAIELANSSPFGLGSAVFTADLTEASTSPTGLRQAWSASTCLFAVRPRCRLAESRTPALAASSDGSDWMSSPTRNSFAHPDHPPAPDPFKEEHMRAAVYYGNRTIKIDDVREPDPRPGEVKVKVHRNGICGTDLHEYYDGPIFIPPSEPHPLTGRAMPLVLGHEFSGTVTEVGADVMDVAVDDRVTIEPVYRCGECRPCLSGRYNLCTSIGFHGLMGDGGMAEHTVVPANQVHRLPESVSLDLGALAEPMSVAYHAATFGDVGDQDSALIYGAGPIGIGLWFALRGMGLTQIDVVEPSAERRAAIERLGASTLDPDAVDVPALIADRTRGDGVDAAFDAAGVAPAVKSALACIGERRPLVSVAIYDRPLTTPLLSLVLRERRIQGTLCYTAEDFRAVLDLMSSGHYDTTGWVDTVPLSDVVDAGFAELRAGRRMKLLVDPAA